MFAKIGLKLKEKKSYFFNSNIMLLEIKVNAFKLIIAKKKLEIIINFIFFANLAKLK